MGGPTAMELVDQVRNWDDDIDRLAAAFLAARVEKLLAILDVEIKSQHNPVGIRGFALILRRVLNGEEP